MPFRKISADEAKAKLEARKERLRDTAGGLAIQRAMKAPPSLDADKRSARFIMSSETVDRYRDIVVQVGLETERFLENPQALLFHNSRSWPIGNWSDITKVLGGRPKRTEGQLNFLGAGIDPDCDRAFLHVANGTIRTVSIGFIPDWEEIEYILDEEEQWTGGLRYNKSELIECSLVPIPAQPDALVKSADGDMVLAKELIEDVLDNWAKTPEGLLIPRSEYEAKHLDVVGQRTTYSMSDESVGAEAAVERTVVAIEPEKKDAPAPAAATVQKDNAAAEAETAALVAAAKDAAALANEPVVLAASMNDAAAALAAEAGAVTTGVVALAAPTAEEIDAFIARAAGDDVLRIARDTIDVITDGWREFVVDRSSDRIEIMRGGEIVEKLTIPDMGSEIRDKVLNAAKALRRPQGKIELELDAGPFQTAMTGILETFKANIRSVFAKETPAEPVVEEAPRAPAPEVVAAAKTQATEVLARLQSGGRI